MSLKNSFINSSLVLSSSENIPSFGITMIGFDFIFNVLIYLNSFKYSKPCSTEFTRKDLNFSDSILITDSDKPE
jgi:hypothetical protein